MLGINLNLPIKYKYASLRFFKSEEKHVTRFCEDNVLLLVYDGTLKFSENGKQIEVNKGEYYVQKKNCFQGGEIPSNAPKYLYIHFDGEWADSDDVLPYFGKFDYLIFKELIEQIDNSSHQNEPYSVMQYLMLKLMLSLRVTLRKNGIINDIVLFIENNLQKIASLSVICSEFHYSKNYVIRIFNKEFGISPIQYVNEVKINKAKYLLETTSKQLSEIANECGYLDYPYFYKRFIKQTGISPQAWRKQKHQNPFIT